MLRCPRLTKLSILFRKSIYENNWHHGVLGIVASKIASLYNKPTFVLSFINDIGSGSGRSINEIDIGTIILELKNNNIIENGGGHKMAVGFKLKKNQLHNLINFLEKKFSSFEDNLFEKITYFDSEISVNQINKNLLKMLDSMEPFGHGNEDPLFLIKDIIIDKFKIIKDKHILIFFKNDLGQNMKGIFLILLKILLVSIYLNLSNINLNFYAILKEITIHLRKLPKSKFMI